MILFLVQLFESSEATEGPRATPWKLLIASSTNVAVDRILLGWVAEAFMVLLPKPIMHLETNGLHFSGNCVGISCLADIK